MTTTLAPPPAYGGFTEVARRLTDAGPRSVSRQGVRAWWLRRERSQFPDYHHLDGDGFKQWNIAEVIDWYARYVPPSVTHWGVRNRKGRLTPA
jgi:hypothetical protein